MARRKTARGFRFGYEKVDPGKLPKKGHCGNRDVVVADGRLHSPKYDDEGDSGGLLWDRAWSEFTEAEAMCYFGICGPRSYNAWITAADGYIFGDHPRQLRGHFHELKKRAMLNSGGLAFPQSLTDKFQEVADFINEWNESGYFADAEFKDNFWHPTAAYWIGKTKPVIDYFDQAACLFDKLDKIALEEIDAPDLVRGAPVMTSEDVPGGYLGGDGGSVAEKKGSALALAAGIVIVGGATYFGYRLLTE